MNSKSKAPCWASNVNVHKMTTLENIGVSEHQNSQNEPRQAKIKVGKLKKRTLRTVENQPLDAAKKNAGQAYHKHGISLVFFLQPR